MSGLGPGAPAAPVGSAASEAGQSTSLRLERLGTFDSPVWAGAAPGDSTHLYLVEKAGRVLRLTNDGVRQNVVLDLQGSLSSGNEQGLLSMAFSPQFATDRQLYVDYTDRAGTTKVVAYTVVAVTARQPRELLSVDQPFANHNGGLLLFDRAGMLLVGLGDGGSAGDPGNRAQDLSNPLGKILRLDPRTGAAAPGGPFAADRRVWAYGLRNPWRFSLDTDGTLYVGDVGQNRVEELDVVPPAEQRGANYGWSVYEGSERFKKERVLASGGSLVTPALTYTHASGGCSITGGEVYRGRAVPSLVGSYVFGDYCAGRLLVSTRTATGVTAARRLGPKVDGLQAFGHDAAGELLVLSADGLHRLIGS